MSIWLVVLLALVAISLFATTRVAISRIEQEIGDGNRLREQPVTQPPIFLASIAPTQRQKVTALSISGSMMLAFILFLPYVRVDGPQLLSFPPMGDALLCVIFFITGFILVGQFLRVRSLSLMILSAGYFFQAVMTIAHGISFSESAMFGTSEQLSPWLYFFWRAIAPMFVIAYTMFHDRAKYVSYPSIITSMGIVAVLVGSVGGSVAMVHWSHMLPTIITSGIDYTRELVVLISPGILVINIIALGLLWLRSNNVLDLWLMVATVGSILDVTIASIIGNQRFDFGYYAGRGFGLMAACIVLGALLNEMYRLYGSLYEIMEQRLKRSEAQYRAIVDSAMDAIIVIDEMGIIQSFNRTAEQIFGYQESEVVGQNVKILMAEPYRSNHDHYLQNYRETGIRKIIGIGRDVQGMTKDGMVLNLEASVAEWMNGNGRRFTGILRDITERKRLEKQLIQSQKMEAVGQLTGGMAHDFNNLLGVVIGNLDMLSDHFPEGEAPEELNDAINASTAGADLVRRLLAFARRQPLLPKIINLEEVIDGLIPLVRRMIGDLIVIETQYDKNLQPVLADPAQLENALLNLIINARDAMPDGGRLLIECRNHDVDEDSSVEYDVPVGCYTALVVSDSGKGIPPHILPHVFEPFFSTKPPGAGSGLGLSMVYGYAKQSGGVVRIYSEVGSGTTVRLYLPSVVETADEENAQEPVSLTNLHGNERILVVEDTPAALVVAQRILVSLGYTVRLAKDATEAIGYIDSGENFDLLFTDIIMPGGINGLELARMVKQRKPLIKVLFASGFSQTPSKDIEILNAKYITKPYRKIDLAQTIRDLLEKR